MNSNEKLDLIRLLAEINGLIIIKKIQDENTDDLFAKEKKVASELSKEGVYDFDFSSDEKLEESINDFLKDF